MPTRRNPVVRAGAILRKGGVHRQSASGHRHQGKRSLCDELDDWYADDERYAGDDSYADDERYANDDRSAGDDRYESDDHSKSNDRSESKGAGESAKVGARGEQQSESAGRRGSRQRMGWSSAPVTGAYFSLNCSCAFS